MASSEGGCCSSLSRSTLLTSASTESGCCASQDTTMASAESGCCSASKGQTLVVTADAGCCEGEAGCDAAKGSCPFNQTTDADEDLMVKMPAADDVFAGGL